MKLAFLQLPAVEQALYFSQSAQRLNRAAVIIEKDFWVCWLLGVLFDSEFGEHLVFKGGTSLSKVHGVIERFSEDVDLSLSPAFLGIANVGTVSKSAAEKWMKHAEARCAEAVRDNIQPVLEGIVRDTLGSSALSWIEYVTDERTKSPVLNFRYPARRFEGFPYIQRQVKLEFGSLTDQQPTEKHAVTPWLVDAIPEALPDFQSAFHWFLADLHLGDRNASPEDPYSGKAGQKQSRVPDLADGFYLHVHS